MEPMEGFCRSVHTICISGVPAAKKTLVAEALNSLLVCGIVSLGNHIRDLYQKSGSRVRFDIWVAQKTPQEMILLHEQFVAQIKGMKIVDMRFPEFLEDAPGLFTVYLGGPSSERAKWAARSEVEREKYREKTGEEYRHLSPAEIETIILKREKDEQRLAKDLGILNHDKYPYDLVIDSTAYSAGEMVWIILGAIVKKNRDLALAPDPKLFLDLRKQTEIYFFSWFKMRKVSF